MIFDTIDDPMELRELVCRATGMHPTDAVQWLARAPGTWPQPLEETTVRELLDGFYEAGIAAEAWRTDMFPDLSPPRTIHRAACMKEGFRIEGLRAEPTHWVPWDRIELDLRGPDLRRRRVSQCSVPPVAVDGRVGNPRPGPDEAPARQPPRRATRIPRDPVGEAIIVRRDPRIAFRVVENQMNYAYLGDRLSHVGRGQFPRLSRRPLRPSRRRLYYPTLPARSWKTETPASTNSPAHRRFSTMRPTDCCGAGIAATAPPSPNLLTQTATHDPDSDDRRDTDQDIDTP